MENNALRDRVYLKLKEAGIDVYLPGQYEGKCLNEYCTVRYGGRVSATKASGHVHIVINCRVPMGKLTQLDDLIVRVQGVMNTMLPVLRPVGDISDELINNDAEAYEASIEYTAQCAL